MSPSRFKLSPAFLASLLVLIAIGHGLLAVLAMREKSTTSDELAHVTGGYTFDHWNDYRMQPENGLLPQRWQALPTVIAGAHYPDKNSAAWRESDVWATGHGFFYELGNNHEWMLFQARAMNALFGVALVLLVAIWAYYLFGWAGAFTAAFFSALCPTMLAHSGLATSDMVMALFLLASVSAYWWHLHDGRPKILLLSAVIFGFACVAKYTAVLLLPLFVLLALVRSAPALPLTLAARTFRTPAGKLGAIAISTLLHGLVAIIVIWTFCGFRYTAFNPSLPPGDFSLSWDYVLGIGGWKAAVINFCRHWHLLPESYLYGFTFVLRLSEARGAFLDGDYSILGWWDFFPKTFFYKTPLSLLLALATGAALLLAWAREKGWAKLRAQSYRVAPLLLLFLVYWLFSLTSHLNIGHRHILPTYPVLYIFTGIIGCSIVRAWHRARAGGVIIGVFGIALFSAHLATAGNTFPNYLAFFNSVAGGSANGYKHLVDSSLDWGQDLPDLQRWLVTHQRPGEPVFISYFGSGEPDYYGITAVRMPMIYRFSKTRPWYWPAPGLYAISATMLQHVYMAHRGPWTVENERNYQRMRANEANFRTLLAKPDSPDLLRTATREEWNHAWSVYEELRFDRLCYYLRTRTPDAFIDYSILVFRLDQSELDIALNGDLRALSRAIEQSLSAPTH